MLIQSGVRGRQSNRINDGKPFDVVMEVSGNAECDFCCFVVDGLGRLSDDRCGVLERLDNMSGRYVVKASLFALGDFKSVSNSELYARLLNEFPLRLKEIRKNG